MPIKLTPIKGYAGFKNVYAQGKKFYTKNLTAIVIFANAPTGSQSNSDKYLPPGTLHIVNYGVTIGKRIAPKAVIRNRVKRLLRAGLHTLAKEMEVYKLLVIDEIILSYQFAPLYPKQIGLSDVVPVIKKILEQAYFFYSKNN